jgi:hypothetical protein
MPNILAGIAGKKRVFKTGNNWQLLIFVVPVVVPKTTFCFFNKFNIL